VKYESEIREQISFYVSTPPYRPVFDLEGWGDNGGRAQSSGKALLTAEWHHLAILDYEIEPAAATSDPVTTHQ
jgi:hypothetical protein